MRAEEILKKMAVSFFVIVTGVVCSIYLFCLIFHPGAVFPLAAFGRILLMAILIIIVLYAAFLGDVWLPDSMKGLEGVSPLMDGWLVSGLLAVASVTTTMGAFGVIIDGRVKKIDRDFCASPFPKSRLTAGYLGSAFLIGTIMSVITFAAAELYIVLRGGDWLAPAQC